MKTFTNPIISGFYPDPSVCRVEDKYYLVTSSFEYFPGIPIFESEDLVNWKQIGHVLDRPSQLNLDSTPCSKGIYAATIRYDKGLFYVVTTFVESKTGERRNFYVTAEDPAGAWSEPNWLVGAPGIDPSLFFDDDGKVYYTGNRVPPNGPLYHKHVEIWMQELDLERKELVGERVSLWDGALKQIHAQEGPHQFKRNGYYYLVIAEGGTGFTHSVTIARSPSLSGPYEVCKMNPILTHRHLGKKYPITNVGHGDFVETQHGDWWMVCLASRPYGGPYRNMGRESFLVPVIWEDDWPVVSPGIGRVELEMERPKLTEKKWSSLPACDSFDSPILDQTWISIRTPRDDFWSLKDRPGFLRLKAKQETITEQVNPSFIGRRQQHMSFDIRTKMTFYPQEQEEAGIVLLQNSDFHYRFVKTMNKGNSVIQLIKRENGIDTIVTELKINAGDIYLKVEADQQNYSFYVAIESENWSLVSENIDGRILSSDVAGGFTGMVMGMYCTSNGKKSETVADFDWFEYNPVSY
ncbi:glycoside hydrolase family 43 protein [Salipaludibacillus sp. HK11]|uniref:glycoside hydrolase family 43 protein n=1 Tax=Salipaludibacillus sp. HK11 TaxID=3394320 RepID=UPI0039FC1F5C